MVHNIYGVLDRRINSFVICKDAANLADFKRWFAMVFLRPDSVYSKFSNDYDIWIVGSFSDPESAEAPKGDMVLTFLVSVSDVIDEFNLARPDMARSSDEA